LKYGDAQSNGGFRMWKNKQEAFEATATTFLATARNWLITIHFSGNAKARAAD